MFTGLHAATKELSPDNFFHSIQSKLKNKKVLWLNIFTLICIVTMATAFSVIQMPATGTTATALAREINYNEQFTSHTTAYSNKQWALSTMNVPQTWDITSGNSDITIAVLDTGIDDNHPDLLHQVIAERNFTSTGTTTDIFGHGTHIAGIIAALNNDKGIIGLAHNSYLLNAKVADDKGRCFNYDIANGIIWATDEGADVINMSLYTFSYSAEVEQAIDYAWNRGAIIICAAGNGTDMKKVYPAVYDNCFSVAASNQKDYLESWSGHGDWVDMAAPGVDIYSTVPGNRYETKTGTSMATAYVSGVAALLYSVAEDTSKNGYVNDEVLAALEDGCDTINGPSLSIGRINAYKAVNSLLQQ